MPRYSKETIFLLGLRVYSVYHATPFPDDWKIYKKCSPISSEGRMLDTAFENQEKDWVI